MLLHSERMAPLPDRSVRLASFVGLILVLTTAARAASPARSFVVDAAKSQVRIHVGKAGLFKFAGHEHDVLAKVSEGEIVAFAQDLGRSQVRLRFAAADLRVTGSGEPPEDVPKVQETMYGPRVLDAIQFPAVTFHSEAVSGREVSPGTYDLKVEGPLKIRDREVRLAFTVRVSVSAERLVATGQGRLRQSDFGIVPISVAGVVRVKDELDLDLHFEAVPRP